jgi:acyl-CoA thioesterase
MRFSEVLQSVRGQAGVCTATVPDEWLQGRTVFGGLQAALAVRAMRGVVPAEVPLRTLQTTFIAPVPAGELCIEASLLRQGKSATQCEARILVDGQVACVNLGIFGAARASTVVVEPPYLPIDVQRQAPREMPYVPGVMPVFTRHFRFRWAEGGILFTGATEPRTKILVQLHDDVSIGEAQVLAIADSIPTPGLSMLKKPAFASSMTWTLELLTTRYDSAPDGEWRLDAEVVAGSEGYLSHSALVWSPDRRPVALSRQSVVIFG